MWDGIPKIKIHCCITIEARADEEMNEVALGTCSTACALRLLCWTRDSVRTTLALLDK
eukprot:COSAG02_NODE_345_length_24135_cov_6.425404_12_plen_58_part_00